ncbi:MAG: glycine/sarcosine/betaine reductase complex component C subunit beta [Finegoldia sp.]|nr:glycine/sarcosine/betaine reductase complex component C subunit beta [Finegoldia sp.]
MSFPVLKAAGYVLVNTPDMIVQNGTTTQTEKVVNPDSDFLKEIGNHIRSFDEVVNYLPNQVYIGNVTPSELAEYDMPYHDVDYKDGKADGKFGKIVDQDVFVAFMEMCDVFDLVKLSEDFVAKVKPRIEKEYPNMQEHINDLKGVDISEGKELIEKHQAEALYSEGEVIGYVKQAHDVDINLSAHTMFENLVVKASGVLAAYELFEKNPEIKREDVDYVIECSEEACGDMNQRGGGNFAKSIAEMVGMVNATGSDTRGFCAAPIHSLIEASALVKSGIYKNVVVLAGGASAKLGMNAKDHVKKDLPVLEDVVGGFAVLISENDGVHPVFRTDIVGRHTVKTGSAPQAVMGSLVSNSLAKAGLKITDIDKFSVEMQNPDITKPAGAGDVPEANFKMIAALAVKEGQIEKADLKTFMKKIGMPGWAPTQGHIPSGVPYAGHAIYDLTEGDLNRVMFVGKGSLFLGRMTNLFDGVSIVLERNDGTIEEEEGSNGSDKEEIKKVIAESMKQLAENLLAE